MSATRKAPSSSVALGPSPITVPSAMRVNVVQVLGDSDFRFAKELCDDHSGWTLAHERKGIRVWTRGAMDPDSPLKMIKARGEFPDVSASLCYQVLQDTDYRHKWDKHMLKTVPIGFLDRNNDLCYYALGGLPPFRSRDFVLLRSWVDFGPEKYILAHSVCHDNFPPTKAHIRGIVHLTVHFVRPSNDGRGCQFSYVTLADPRGKLPGWLINHVTKIIAPKLVKKLHKACLKYAGWRRKHGKGTEDEEEEKKMHFDYPRIVVAQCVPPMLTAVAEEVVDESAVEETVKKEEGEEEEDEE